MIERHPNSVLRKELDSVKVAIKRLKYDIDLATKAIIVLNEKIERHIEMLGQLADRFDHHENPLPPTDDSV